MTDGVIITSFFIFTNPAAGKPKKSTGQNLWIKVVDKLPYRPIVNLLFAAPCEIRFAPFALVAGSRQLQASL
jgi:hypothetical protein